MRKFNTFSGASWIPGPPISGEKLRQLMVYLGVPWSDLMGPKEWEEATFESVLVALEREISIKFPIVRRQIELLSLPDQAASEGPWEYWRKVVHRCSEGSIGSRTTGLDLNYDQFCMTLFLKGLRESDRMKIHQNFLNYDCSWEQMEEIARSLEQNQVSLKSNPCLLYTSPSPRDGLLSRMPSSA